MSRPAWGAWIEIVLMSTRKPSAWSRPAWGAWIEMMRSTWATRLTKPSRPAWGAWIEILVCLFAHCLRYLSRPAWGAWIEIYIIWSEIFAGSSRPAWGAWIEMDHVATISIFRQVAPRMGRVD